MSEIKTYFIHSMVRRVQTRTKRAMAPKRHRFVLRIGGGEITVRRGRHRNTPVSEERLLKHLEELKQCWEAGMLEVRDSSGRVVDLNTMEAVGKPAPPVPQPKKVLDTAATDKPAGEKMPAYVEGKALGEEAEKPSVADDSIPEGKEAPPARRSSRKKARK